MPYSKASKVALKHCTAIVNVKISKAEKPRSPEHGDISVALFEAAKTLGKNPVQLAQEISLQKPPREFEKVQAVGPFVNFFYSDALILRHLKKALNENWGENNSGKGKTAVVEYSQPNIGKPMHVGHIRSTILGDVVARSLKNCGWKTYSLNYIGDSGSQVAKLLLAFEKFKDMPEPVNEKVMFDYYVKIHEAIEKDSTLLEESRKILEKLESGDLETVNKAIQLREKSYEAFQRNYDLLDVSFDEVIGESQFIIPSRKVVDELVTKGIAFKDKNGEIVAKLEPEQPNTIILRSNGTTLYNTRDLSLAEFKLEKYAYDESIILTAQEQKTHFQQVLLMLQKLGRKSARGYKHVSFGSVNLEEGKMSTRKGLVVFLEDVLNESIQCARTEVEKRENTPSIVETSKAVGVGSFKFAFLRVSPDKQIVFNAKKAVSFEGDTGAYVEYSHVRASSILEKASTTKINLKPLKTLDEEERKLAKKIIEFPQAVKHSAESLEPHQLCDYLLSLSHAFNSFYSKNQVIGSENQEEKLSLIKATQNTLAQGLKLLGIKPIQKM